MTMNVSLPPQMADLVKNKVASGRYGSTGEVISEALLLLDEVDQLREARLKTLKADLEEGVNSGQGIPAEAVIKELRERYGADQ